MSGFVSVPIPAQRKRNRRRALSLIGFSQNFGTHLIHGSGGIGVSPLITTEIINGPNRRVSNVTQANPASVTTFKDHEFTTGQVVEIEDIGGMVELTDGPYTITVTGANTFTLDGINSTGFTAYTSGGTAREQIRETDIMFQTRIRILANAGVHKGLIFEIGSSTRGCAAWVGDQTIGFTAGSGTVANDRAEAIFDFGAELPPTREFQLIFAVKTGSGRIRILDGGLRIADETAVNGDFNGNYSDDENGSFASALVGTITPGVPAASQIAPDGFEVIEPLTIFNGQHPREFF